MRAKKQNTKEDARCKVQGARCKVQGANTVMSDE